MNKVKEIQTLHNKGFVILKAQRTTNAPIGWKSKDKWGYVEEMQDKDLVRYKQTFDAHTLAKSHCGFYLGHNNLCCIDLDVKKTKVDVKAIIEKIIGQMKDAVCIETTKSGGYHIYFKFKTDLPNNPDFTVTQTANWIEVYYRSRFIACYLSNSKRYSLIYGSPLNLKELTAKEHANLLKYFDTWKGIRPKPKKSKPVVIDAETLKRVECYVEQIESKGLDITGDNPRWFKIGKAFASALGEKGFDSFNKVSRFSPLYNEDTIKDQYQSFVDGDKRERGTKITIATFFHLCEEHGLLTLEAHNALKLYPSKDIKEFALELTRKEKMYEHAYKLVKLFKEVVPVCCVDKAHFYVFEETHWKLKSERDIYDLINTMLDRTDAPPELYTALRSLPYMEMYIAEIRLSTHRPSLEPLTGNLNEEVFINMENGVLRIDLKTGKRDLLDHSPHYNFTTVLPYAYDATQRCPKFDVWMDTQIPEKEFHTAYYAFVASCLTKHKADIIMLLAGDTSTGKSSLIDITRKIVGEENATPISAGTLFSGKPEAASIAMQMENKLLSYDFDAQPFKALEMLLKVAAQEPIQGWQMNVARRPVLNYGRVIIAMNPLNYSVFNAAVARRFITISMEVKVEKDNSVMPSIYEHEMAGIFNHVVNVGIKHLIENKGQIKQSRLMKKTTLDFHTRERDSVRWFNDRYEVVDVEVLSKNKKISIEDKIKQHYGKVAVFKTISEMYQDYRLWLEVDEGYSPHALPIRKYFVSDLKLINVTENVYFLNGKSSRGVFLFDLKKL